MNARQRRAARRRNGMRAPYVCFWCRDDLPGWASPCSCGPRTRIRVPLGDMSLSRFAAEANSRGLDPSQLLQLRRYRWRPAPDPEVRADHALAGE